MKWRYSASSSKAITCNFFKACAIIMATQRVFRVGMKSRRIPGVHHLNTICYP